VWQKLCRLRPDNLEWLSALAVSHTNLGVIDHDSGQGPGHLRKAEEHWQKAVHLQAQAARQQPNNSKYQMHLAVGYANLALLYMEGEQNSRAGPLLRKSDRLLTAVVRKHPESSDYANKLVAVLRLWGGLQIKTGRRVEARATYTRAIQLIEMRLREDPPNQSFQGLLLVSLVGRMDCCVLLHCPQDAEPDWQRALSLAVRLHELGELCNWAHRLGRRGDYALAAGRAEQLAEQKGIVAEDLFTLVRVYALAAAAAQKDRALSTTEQTLKADRYEAAALALLDGLSRKGYFQIAKARKLLERDDDLGPLRGRDDFRRLVQAVAQEKRR
jgi:tetratricopeptide (TPR) repeat protein